MGYMNNGLSLDNLRQANLARLSEASKDKKHKFHKSTKWQPSQWLQAVIGELGEYANLRKKYERGDITYTQFKKEAAKELADVQCYLDILASHLEINLEKATKDKFNEVSERVGSKIYIGDDNDWHINT